MDDWKEFTGKTVDEALTAALIQLEAASENIDYEVIERESKGLLGMFSKPAKIRVKKKFSIAGNAEQFLNKVFKAMGIDAEAKVSFDEVNESVDVDILGNDMGVLIGKRGQTLDSLQYLTSLVVNKNSDSYLKVKLDTENYRERRKETLENLAKNIASKVKRTHKSVSLEPMNPYERRIIHSALQNDKFVETHSEGDEPYRKVVITLKKGVKEYNKYNQNNPAARKFVKPGVVQKRFNHNTNSDKEHPKETNKEDVKDKSKDYGKEYNKDYSNDYKKDYAAYLEAKAAAKAADSEKKD